MDKNIPSEDSNTVSPVVMEGGAQPAKSDIPEISVINAGHVYELKNVDYKSFPNGNILTQTLVFIKKAPIEGSQDKEMEVILNGTTNEIVIKVLINRLQYLNTLFECSENNVAIQKLSEALAQLEKRTAGRRQRGVAGKFVA